MLISILFSAEVKKHSKSKGELLCLLSNQEMNL